MFTKRKEEIKKQKFKCTTRGKQIKTGQEIQMKKHTSRVGGGNVLPTIHFN